MGDVHEISGDQCRELLAGHEIGRIAICTHQGPRIYPVNYRLDGDDVILRTAPYSDLGQALIRGADAAFEVDHLDRGRQAGWSVHVSGTAHPVEAPAAGAGDHAAPTPWASGSRPLVVRLAAREISGRRIGTG